MEQARHAASTKRHSRHELQNRRKRKPVFLRMMGVLLVAGAALACFGFWRFQTPGIVLGPFEDEPSTAESVPPPEPEPQPVTTTLRFSATGDNLIHAPIYKQAARRAAEGQRYNFDYCYEHLLDFMPRRMLTGSTRKRSAARSWSLPPIPAFLPPVNAQRLFTGQASGCLVFPTTTPTIKVPKVSQQRCGSGTRCRKMWSRPACGT